MSTISHFSACLKDFRVEELYEIAMNLVGWRLEYVESFMLKHPEEYPDYTAGQADLDSTETNLVQLIGNAKPVDELMDAHCAVCAALAIEMYLRGVLDGGSLYHALTNSELPVRK